MSVEIRKKGVESRVEDIRGQGGTIVPVNETRFSPDEVILDPNSPLAVQIPEDSDADRSRIGLPLADALFSGHVEAKFGTVEAPLPAASDASNESEHVRAIGDDSGDEHTPDHERVDSPAVHNEPEVVRSAKVVQDVEKDSPASSK